MPNVIQIENLSKKYSIGARKPGYYSSFREMLTERSKRMARRLVQPVRQDPASAGSTETEFWALKNINMEIKQGDRIGIIGSNGAGKSTLLKILSRITEPTAGRVIIRGRVTSLLEVGTGFHQELTGRENVFLNGAILGMGRREILRIFDEIVAFSGVERFIDTPVKRYSSGMYVRLAFSVAANLNPEILIIDEVLAVGDAEFYQKSLAKMKEVAKLGKTVIIVSHNMNSISNLCSVAYWLDQGEVKLVGPVSALVDAYLNHRADLLRVGSPEVNNIPLEYVSEPGLFTLEKVRLCNPANSSFAVYWKQPVELELEFTLKSPLNDFVIGTGYRCLDDYCLSIRPHTDETGHLPWKMDAGRYVIRCVLQNPLRPGLYKMCFGGYCDPVKRVPVFQSESIVLEILEHDKNGKNHVLINPGYVDIDVHWEKPQKK